MTDEMSFMKGQGEVFVDGLVDRQVDVGMDDLGRPLTSRSLRSLK